MELLGPRFRSSEEGRTGERVAPPESPPESTAFHIQSPKRPQLFFITPRRADIRDDQPASGSQNPERFGDGLLAIRSRRDVVNRETGKDEIERRILIRERPHISRVDMHPVANPFKVSVVERDFLSIP